VRSAQAYTKTDHVVEPEESVAAENSPITVNGDVVFQVDFFQYVEVREHEDDINATDVHSKDFSTESSLFKHFFAHFNDEARFGYVVPSKEEAGQELDDDGKHEYEAEDGSYT
jgi:hypothetical protein